METGNDFYLLGVRCLLMSINYKGYRYFYERNENILIFEPDTAILPGSSIDSFDSSIKLNPRFSPKFSIKSVPNG